MSRLDYQVPIGGLGHCNNHDNDGENDDDNHEQITFMLLMDACTSGLMMEIIMRMVAATCTACVEGSCGEGMQGTTTQWVQG